MAQESSDFTIKPEQYGEVLRKFDRKKEHNKITEANEAGRTAAGSIGGETPLLVLMDVRKELSDLSNRLDESNSIMRELLASLNNARDDDAIKSEQRHKDMLAYMSQISDAISSSRSIVSHPSVSLPQRSKTVKGTGSETTYYYYDFQIKNTEAVVGCILMHLCMLVTNNLGDFNEKETTLFGLQEWTSAVRYVRLMDKFKLPKFDTYDVQQSLEVVASDTLGRRVVLKIEHIGQLCNTCPTIMVGVEEMRRRIIQCPGVVTLSKSKQLATLDFPYVTIENTLNITDTDPKIAGSDALVDIVRSMNDTQKKSYTKEILLEGKRPMVAARHAKSL